MGMRVQVIAEGVTVFGTSAALATMGKELASNGPPAARSAAAAVLRNGGRFTEEDIADLDKMLAGHNR